MTLSMLTRSSHGSVAKVVVMAALPWCVALRADAGDKLPSGEKVMDTFIKNSGGKEAYRRVKTRVKKARLDTAQGSVTMTIYGAVPNKAYIEFETPMGSMRRGTDGNVVWQESPMGMKTVTGDERDTVLRDMMFHPDLEWRKIYAKAVCEEITEFAGEMCYRLFVDAQGRQD